MQILAPRRADRRAGFTLVEVIVAVAIIAVLAGAITPLVFRELLQAREDATLRELKGLSGGLASFYADTGRLPTQAEGLAALVVNPGVTGWQGPYVAGGRGNPVTEATTDEFGRAYIYDASPTTIPAGLASAVIASGGADGVVSSGRVGAAWTVAGDGDDLLELVVLGPLDRDKIARCEAELATLGDAVRAFFEDRAVFPANLGALVPAYLDPGFGGGTFADPWRQPYSLFLQSGGTAPPVLFVRSRGPNRQDNGGAGDDLQVAVSSVPPGRRATMRKLEIAQTLLNSNPSLVLTGSWPVDRTALGLAAPFDADGWGRPFGINVASRTVFSAGPDGNAVLVDDNLPPGVGP